MINKENSIESPLDFPTLLIQLLHGLCTTFPHLSCDTVTSCHVVVTMWHLWCDTFPHSLLCSPREKKKKKKRKENINNNLVVLPSHNIYIVTQWLLLWVRESVKINNYCTMYYCSLIYKLCLHNHAYFFNCHVMETFCFFWDLFSLSGCLSTSVR